MNLRESRDVCCLSCMFFQKGNRTDGRGECRRNPPVMAYVVREDKRDSEHQADTVMPQNGGWPFVYDADWCGEFKLKIEAR